MTKNPKNYINNSELLEVIKEYKAKYDLAVSENKPLPQMPNKLGIAFQKISENFAHNYSFRNYVFKDELIQDGILACVKAVDSFDPERTQNPFAFFTQCVYFLFLQI